MIAMASMLLANIYMVASLWVNMAANMVMGIVATGFFSSSVTGLKTVVTAIGAGIGVWGVINLLEGYSNDNPGAKSQGIKQVIPK